MANLITRAGALGPYVSATYQTIPTAARTLGASVIVAERPVVHLSGRKHCTPESWAKNSLTGSTMIKSGVGGKCRKI